MAWQPVRTAIARTTLAMLALGGATTASGGDSAIDAARRAADAALGRANITVNKNTVPNDPRSPFVTSGLRIGSPAITTRGFKEAEATRLAGLIADVLDNTNDEAVIARVKAEVLAICKQFPVYG